MTHKLKLTLFFLMIKYVIIHIKKSILGQSVQANLCVVHFIPYSAPKECSLVSVCIMHLCLTRTGYVVARHKAVCCGATGCLLPPHLTPPLNPAPLHLPCSGVRRLWEVLQPEVIVNYGGAAKTGCYGVSHSSRDTRASRALKLKVWLGDNVSSV